MSNLTGKKVVITGGTGGLGKAIAIAFAQQGTDIIITYHSSLDTANSIIEEIKSYNVKVKAIQINLENDAEHQKLIQESNEFLGDIDIFVNNAGAVTRKPFIDLPKEDIEKIISINLLAPFFLMQYVARNMVAQQQKLTTQDKELVDRLIGMVKKFKKKIRVNH